MIPGAIRSFLRRAPRIYYLMRYGYWLGRYYSIRQVQSKFSRKVPIIHGYWPDRSNELTAQIQAVNLLDATEMCRVMSWHGSDKGHSYHNYTAIYSTLFSHRRKQPLRILEVGLGTNNPAFPANMGEMGRPGASLRGWRDLFPRSEIYGADIDRECLFDSERIRTFYCNQLDPESIRALWDQPALRVGVDIMIDDGLHTFEGNVSLLKESLNHLKAGGTYVVEDIYSDQIERWKQYIAAEHTAWLDFNFALIELPNPWNRHANNILVVRRNQVGDKTASQVAQL